jgi:hypothetical protein
MLDPSLGPGGLIVVVLKDRPERSPPAVRERIRPLSRLCAFRTPMSRASNKKRNRLRRASLAPEKSARVDYAPERCRLR